MQKPLPTDNAEIARQEMALYDSLDPCIREVISAHAEGFYLLGLSQNNPNAYIFAKQCPEFFARELRKRLDAQAKLVSAIMKILDEPDTRTVLIKEGNKRLENFSWSKSALKTLDVYRNSIVK